MWTLCAALHTPSALLTRRIMGELPEWQGGVLRIKVDYCRHDWMVTVKPDPMNQAYAHRGALPMHTDDASLMHPPHVRLLSFYSNPMAYCSYKCCTASTRPKRTARRRLPMDSPSRRTCKSTIQRSLSCSRECPDCQGGLR